MLTDCIWIKISWAEDYVYVSSRRRGTLTSVFILHYCSSSTGTCQPYKYCYVIFMYHSMRILYGLQPLAMAICHRLLCIWISLSLIMLYTFLISTSLKMYMKDEPLRVFCESNIPLNTKQKRWVLDLRHQSLWDSGLKVVSLYDLICLEACIYTERRVYGLWHYLQRSCCDARLRTRSFCQKIITVRPPCFSFVVSSRSCFVSPVSPASISAGC